MFCTECGAKNDDAALFCVGCGKSLHTAANTEHHLSAAIPPVSGVSTISSDSAPDGIKGWSWGAFFLNWIWAIGNKTWIGLLALVPFVGFIMSIALGIKGREWAWKNNHWDSVEHFNRVQKKWSVWGMAIVGSVAVIAILAAVATPTFTDYQQKVLAAIDAQGQSNPKLEDMTLDEATKAMQEETPPAPPLPAAAPASEPTLPGLSAAAEKAVAEGFVVIKNPTVQACTDARMAAIKKEMGEDSPITYETYNEAAVKCGFNI